jgi:hypothetical protein
VPVGSFGIVGRGLSLDVEGSIDFEVAALTAAEAAIDDAAKASGPKDVARQKHTNLVSLKCSTDVTIFHAETLFRNDDSSR